MVFDGEILDRQLGKVLEDLESEQSDFTVCCCGARERERWFIMAHRPVKCVFMAWRYLYYNSSLWHCNIMCNERKQQPTEYREYYNGV